MAHLNFHVELDPARPVSAQDLEDVQRLMRDVVAVALAARPRRREAVREQLVNLLVGDVALRAVDMKRARLEAQAVRAIRQGTQWLTAAEIGELANLGPANPIATVSRWKQQGRIFALRQGGKDHYPQYALGPDFHPLPVVKDILATLAGYEPELLAGWFDSSSRFLGGQRPRELLAQAPARVLAAARHLIEVQEHQA